MERVKLDIWVGIFVALGIIAMFYLATRVGNLTSNDVKKTYEVKACFENIGGLKPRAAVKASGVVVGLIISNIYDHQTFTAFIKIKIYTLDANSNSEIVKYTGYTRQVSISLNNDQKCRKPQVTWKQHPNIAASTITEHRRQSTIRCANGLIKRNPVYLGKTLLSNRINAKPVCSWYNPVTCKYETVKGPNPLTQSCHCLLYTSPSPRD